MAPEEYLLSNKNKLDFKRNVANTDKTKRVSDLPAPFTSGNCDKEIAVP